MDKANTEPVSVLFDSNTWEHVVHPDRRPRDSSTPAARRIRRAIERGNILPVLSEASVLIDQIPMGERKDYFKRTTACAIHVETIAMGNGLFRMEVHVGGVDAERTMHPKFKLRVADALRLGFRVIFVSRMGTMYPAEPNLGPSELPVPAGKSLDEVLTIEHGIKEAIESRGLGLAKLEMIAKRIQSRNSTVGSAWFDGLDTPQDALEEREIQRAFAEWADGDSVAAAIAYQIGIYCTNDRGISAGVSIHDSIHREWVGETYGLRFLSMAELDEEIGQFID